MQRLNLVQISLGDIWLLQFQKSIQLLKKIVFSKIIFNFFFQIDSITLDPDPNWAKILDPDPKSMYLDPQHCMEVLIFVSFSLSFHLSPPPRQLCSVC